VIVRDATPPVIRLEPFPGVVRSADPSISLAGSIVEEHLDTLRLGHRRIPVIDGCFKAPLRLKEGRNVFTLKARDRLGWETEKKIDLLFRRIPRGLVTVEGSEGLLCEQDGAKMAFIPGGPFSRGSKNGRPDEAPPGTVEISPFYMDKTEVTNRRYGKFLAWMKSASNPHKHCHKEEPKNKDHTPRFWKDPKWNGPDQPVVGVDWFDAYAYARWAGKRLPTEAEWEKAASWDPASGNPRTFPWGEDPPKGGRCNFGNTTKVTKPVGAFEGDQSPSGLMDMAGNVREWCLDWYEKGFYARTRAAGADPKNLYPPQKRFRVLRGGAWNDAASHLRGQARGYLPPRAFSPAIGFRCVLSEKR
jgi:formylglycine-generating enzyme required for sulfatase activity